MNGNFKRAGYFLTSGYPATGLSTRAHAARNGLHGYGYLDSAQANANSRLGVVGEGPGIVIVRDSKALPTHTIQSNCGYKKEWLTPRSVHLPHSPRRFEPWAGASPSTEMRRLTKSHGSARDKNL